MWLAQLRPVLLWCEMPDIQHGSGAQRLLVWWQTRSEEERGLTPLESLLLPRRQAEPRYINRSSYATTP